MKTMIAIIFVFMSVTAFAQETIRITAGNSVTIRPQTEVRVVCEGTSTTYQSIRFCHCRPNFYNTNFSDLIQVIKGSDGTVVAQTVLYSGLYFGDCYNAMVNNINCR